MVCALIVLRIVNASSSDVLCAERTDYTYKDEFVTRFLFTSCTNGLKKIERKSDAWQKSNLSFPMLNWFDI